MDGFDQLEAFAQTIGERVTEKRAAASMQDQHTLASALPAHSKIDPLQPLDGRCATCHRVLLASAGGKGTVKTSPIAIHRPVSPIRKRRFRVTPIDHACMIVNSLNDEDKEEIAIYEDLQSRLPKGRGRFLEIEPPPPSPRSPARG